MEQTIDNMRSTITTASKIHGSMADELRALGGVLRCHECGAEHGLGNIAAYLASGWPEHCGKTMEWVTAKLLREAAEKRASQREQA